MLQPEPTATSRTAALADARLLDTSILRRRDVFCLALQCADAIEGLSYRVRSDDESISLRLSGVTKLEGPSAEDFNGHSREYLARRALEQYQAIRKFVIPELIQLGEIDLGSLFSRFVSSLPPLLGASPATQYLLEAEELARACQKAIKAKLPSMQAA